MNTDSMLTPTPVADISKDRDSSYTLASIPPARTAWLAILDRIGTSLSPAISAVDQERGS
jgi:hypothetical protein